MAICVIVTIEIHLMKAYQRTYIDIKKRNVLYIHYARKCLLKEMMQANMV